MDIIKDIQELVELNGDKIGIHSADCVLWKIDHENCKGCQYELGCAKSVKMLLLVMNPYEPRGYTDYAKIQERIAELTDRTMAAKTIKELQSIPLA